MRERAGRERWRESESKREKERESGTERDGWGAREQTVSDTPPHCPTGGPLMKDHVMQGLPTKTE